MLPWLKKHFIPHEGNDHQPHFLRLKITVGLFALILVVEALYLAQTFIVFPKSDYLAAIFATVLVDQTNTQRAAGELHALLPNDLLKKAAQMKADDMAAKGYFAHVTPDGKEPWYWFDQAGYKYIAAGENLAVNFTDSTDVTHAWMQSPTHRANIMNGNYTEIGIATAEGVYKGRSAIFVVEEFGLPAQAGRPAPVAAVVPAVASLAPILPANPSTLPKAQPPVRKPVPTPSTTTVAPVVAGAETLAPTETEEVAVREEDTVVPPPVVSSAVTAPERTQLFARAIASPRHTAAIFYALLAALLMVALGLAIFIEMRIQHAYIIWNGVLLVAFIGALIALNVTLGVGAGAVAG